MFRFALWRVLTKPDGSKRKIYFCYQVRFEYDPAIFDRQRPCRASIDRLRMDVPAGQGALWREIASESVSLPFPAFTKARARKMALRKALAQVKAFSRQDRRVIWACYHYQNPRRRGWLDWKMLADAQKSTRIAERMVASRESWWGLEKVHLVPVFY